MERVEAGQPYPVFVDYAHTDDALRNALRMLRAVTPADCSASSAAAATATAASVPR
jgi:UDP-N-acetylmuramyl tripeptide synthase